MEEKLTVACSDIVSKLDDNLLSPGTGGTIQYKIKLQIKVHNKNLIFLFFKQNIYFGCSREPSR